MPSALRTCFLGKPSSTAPVKTAFPDKQVSAKALKVAAVMKTKENTAMRISVFLMCINYTILMKKSKMREGKNQRISNE